MKSVSDKFKKEIKKYGRQIDTIITYTDSEGEHLLDSDVLFSITPTVNGNILKSVMKQLDFESSVKVPKNTMINVRFGVQIDLSLTVEEVNAMMVSRLNSLPVKYLSSNLKGFEYINLGNYIVSEEPKHNADTQSYSHVCYDKMLYSMKDYEKIDITYPITIREYINKVCEYLGLIFKIINDTFANYDKQIKLDLYEGYDYTFRDILDELAQVTASTICINESSDELEVRYLNETNDTIDEDYLKDTNVGFSEKYGPINSVVLSRSAESDNVYLQDENSVSANGLCELKIIDNQIMNDNDRSDFLPDILEKLDGLEYYINDFSSTGITWYELCDKYTVKIGDNLYNCVLFNDEIKITQGLEETIYTEMPESSETDYSKADKTDRKINKTYIIVDKQNKKIESLISQIGDRTEKSTSITQDINGITEKIDNIEKSAITSVVVEYALSDSPTTEPKENWSTTAPEWQEGKYMWQRTVTTYEDKTVVTGKAICISGATGQQGDNGIGVKKVETQYYLSTSKTEQTGGSWKNAQDTWEEGTYYWIRTKITYDNDEVEYTTPILNEDTNSLREAITEVKKTADGLVVDVTKKLGIEELGTQLEQNYEHVKVAWNKISEFIQMMILNNNASLAILDQNKNVMMSLDKTGQHFYKSDGKTIFGEMGVQTIDDQNFISFTLPTDYDNQIQDGMAWGVTTSSDDKFHPILYIKNFTMPPESSDGCTGELVLDGCDLVLNSANAGIVATGLKIHGDAMPGVFFTDTETGESILSIMPNNGISDTSLYMLGNICFFKNQAGGSSFRIGDSDGTYCLFSDDGYIMGKNLSLGNLIINGEDGHVSGDINFGNLPTYLSNYKLVYARGHEISMEWRNNSQLVFWVDTTNVGTLSDKRLKTDIKYIDEDFIKAIKEVEMKQFKVANRNGLISFGILAQDLIEIFKKYNKNPFDYEIVYETQYRTDDDTIYYAINYEQFLILRQYAKEKELEELEEKDRQKDEIIADLIKRIENLEGGHSK